MFLNQCAVVFILEYFYSALWKILSENNLKNLSLAFKEPKSV